MSMQQALDPYRSLILRIALGFTVAFWGYEKLTVDKLAGLYLKDYEGFMFLDVDVFLALAGWGQIALGLAFFLGLLTRLGAAIAVFMGLVTILIPGVLILKDVPHFAYAFAFTGAALVLLADGGGRLSLDEAWQRRS